MQARETAGEYEVMVDISEADLDLIDDMIYTFNIETEMCWLDSGIRMWFKKPIFYNHESEGICALGFEVKWEIVKCTENEIVEKEDIENEGVRQELPDFLTCIQGAEYFYEEISDYYQETKEIDNRKNMLFTHNIKIRHLNNHERILKFINTNSPTVVLQQKDLDIIIQDDTIRVENKNEYEVARQLIDKLRIVKFNDSLFFYDRNHYCKGDNFVKGIVAQELKGQKSRYTNEVIRQIEICAPLVKVPPFGFVIKFKNGCLYNGQWLDIDYTDFTPYYINLSYYPNVAPVPIVDKFLSTFTEDDEAYAHFIMETIAHCLITDVDVKRYEDFQRVTFFRGDGKNGKGVLLNVIRALLGTENVSSLSLDRIIDERYLYTMRGKLANLGDDIENKVIEAKKMKLLKNLAAFDVIEIRKLYEQSISEAITASQIFTTNHSLKSLEKGEAWKRRVKSCPAFAKPKVKDPDLQKKLTSQAALEYLLKLVIDAYKRLYEFREFTDSKKVKEYTEQYHEENNSALAWVRSKGKDYFINKRSPQVYNDNNGDDYLTWHKENIGGTPLNNKQLKETILEFHGLVFKNTSVKGKSNWLFKEK
ncbi:DUF5906 domain-containing protein [Bacillus stratosphericus]|nr:DUF5906 domain-containing protein [Bacillus stratosphericus]